MKYNNVMKHGVSVFFVALALSFTTLAASGLTEAMLQKFAQLEAYYALPSGALAKIAMVESSGNASKTNPSSSAAGLFQWLRGSWLQATRAHYGHALPPEQRFNPFIASEVTAFSLGQIQSRNGGLVRQAGVDPTVGLYMGHFLGEGGARKFFSLMIQNPHAPAAPYFPTQARSNPTIFGNNSFAQIVNIFAAKLRAPGVFALSSYNNGVFADASQYGRTLDANAAAGLNQMYVGPIPTTDPERDYQTDYSAPSQLNPPPPNVSPPPTSPPTTQNSVLPSTQTSTSSQGSLRDAYGTPTTPTAPTPLSSQGVTGIDNAFRSATSTSRPPSTSATSTEKVIAHIAEEKPGQISVTAPKPTQASNKVPLTEEEFLRLQAQQNVIEPPEETTDVVVINFDELPFGAAPSAGFTYTEVEEAPPTALLRMYVDVLAKVSLALSEALRILRGESAVQ